MFNKKLGYYICEGKEFNSKIHACLYSMKVKKPFYWYFNNKEFESYDWSQEPTETLDQLYDQRAKQLREKYDYLILSYSGGSDSHNILMSFIRQGLKLDEIIVNTMEKGTKNFTELNFNNKSNKNAAAEHYLQTVPMLKKLENLLTSTKITVLDLTDHLFESLETIGDASWILNKNEQVNIAGATRFNYIHFSDIRKKFDKNISIGLIVGLEKPRTWIKKGIFYLGFNDRPANIVTVAEHFKEYTNTTVEFFYWSPDAIKIVCKQAHTIKRYVEIFPDKQLLWDLDQIKEPYSIVYRLKHERILRTIIYTTWNDNWYQADKAIKDWYSEFDAWFYEGFINTKAYHVWQEGLNYLEQNLSSIYIIKDENHRSDGLMSFIHSYKIGVMKNDKIE
jgi:hypothetical protein